MAARIAECPGSTGSLASAEIRCVRCLRRITERRRIHRRRMGMSGTREGLDGDGA